MSRIRKPQAIRAATGMNSGGSNAPSPNNALANGGDNVPAVMTDQQGNPQGPAMIKQGEFVFSVEAIIGAGKGNYDEGLQIITQLHDELRKRGMQFQQQGSLASQGMDQNQP